jgi:hypothetical protein
MRVGNADNPRVGIEDRDYWLDVPEYRRLVGERPRREGLEPELRDAQLRSPSDLDTHPAGGGIPEGIDLRGMLRVSDD